MKTKIMIAHNSVLFYVKRRTLQPVAAPALKNPKEVGGGDLDIIFQSKGIPN